MSYLELIRSNWGFVSDENQEKIRNARVLLAGCGLGSNIALLAARTGFTNFVLADGDTVKIGNLNRQSFRSDHLDRNKAVVTAELINEINPEVKIEVFPQFITSFVQVEMLVSKADLIVNMVDPGEVIFQLNQTAVKQDKPVFFPLNLGFGGIVFVFTRESASLEQMASPDNNLSSFFINLVLKVEPLLPEYLKGFLNIRDRAVSEGLSLPQLGIAANISSALVVTAMIKSILGIPISLAPRPLTLDSWQTIGDPLNRGASNAQ